MKAKTKRFWRLAYLFSVSLLAIGVGVDVAGVLDVAARNATASDGGTAVAQSNGGPGACYWEVFNEFRERLLFPRRPMLRYADGTKVPLARAFEKEGLFYRDIAAWFDRVDRVQALTEVRDLLAKERQRGRIGDVQRWLADYARRYAVNVPEMTEERWASLDAEARVNFIFDRDGAFDVINLRGREALFLDGVLGYYALRPGPNAPPSITVDDDMGSYEVRSRTGEADRGEYLRQRAELERYLDGRVGHQHIVHAWPTDAAKRAAMAPRYVELLDAGTWFLFWRQINRDPDEVESILLHQWLGIYARNSLHKLHDAVVSGDPERFKNKYRMIGARAVRAIAGLPGQDGQGWLPDFELRSGNKGIKRDFMEDMLEARIATGDYSGLRDFRSYEFSPSTSIEELLAPHLTAEQIATVKQFERAFHPMRWSGHPLAHNHLRNRLTAPLLPWRNRLPLEHKAELLAEAQRVFAAGLLRIATRYLQSTDAMTGRQNAGEIRDTTIGRLERLAFHFARTVRLDEDFERYLKPRPGPYLPPITVTPTGPIDVNRVDLGIEYSFRFPMAPRSPEAAERELRGTAEAFARALGGGSIERMQNTGPGHGHGLDLKYRVTAANGDVWRVEWDGIIRDYEAGRAINARGGHIEIPTPKKAPQNADDIVRLYHAMREFGREPKRAAGGGHLNMDLNPLFALPAEEGARKLANLIALFESKREMIQYLWQHPFRTRAAAPYRMRASFIERLNAFRGDWNALGRILYGERYFNPLVSRKPAYSQVNVLAVMGPFIPPQFQQPIDIKNPEVQWFPSFGGKGKDRIELRLFDAPPDEYFAVLQVLYMRALMNAAFNGEAVVPLAVQYDRDAMDRWRDDPAAFIREAEAHLASLRLDPALFLPLIIDATKIQQAEPRNRSLYEEWDGF